MDDGLGVLLLAVDISLRRVAIRIRQLVDPSVVAFLFVAAEFLPVRAIVSVWADLFLLEGSAAREEEGDEAGDDGLFHGC